MERYHCRDILDFCPADLRCKLKIQIQCNPFITKPDEDQLNWFKISHISEIQEEITMVLPSKQPEISQVMT